MRIAKFHFVVVADNRAEQDSRPQMHEGASTKMVAPRMASSK
jgi:hypothetical protein